MTEIQPPDWEVTLSPRGVERYLSAGFLCLWLCGWAIGEAFALGFLIMGAQSLLTGRPVAPEREQIAWGPSLLAGGFILVWLVFWTYGGVAAMRELLRLVWSRDRLSLSAGGLTIERQIGPFRSRREIARAELVSIRLLPRARALVADTTARRVEISDLGTRADRVAAAGELRARLDLDERAADPIAAAVPPAGWQEVVSPEGLPVLVRDGANERRADRALTVVAIAAAGVAILLVNQAFAATAFIPLAAMAAAAALGLFWWRRERRLTRLEWRLESGAITLQRRHGSSIRDEFAGRALELVVTTDRDHDDRFALNAVASTGGQAPSLEAPPARRQITTALRDPVGPRRLGAWLSRRARIPLVDRTTEEARDAAIARLLALLPEHGRLGRLAARFIDRVVTAERSTQRSEPPSPPRPR